MSLSSDLHPPRQCHQPVKAAHRPENTLKISSLIQPLEAQVYLLPTCDWKQAFGIPEPSTERTRRPVKSSSFENGIGCTDVTPMIAGC